MQKRFCAPTTRRALFVAMATLLAAAVLSAQTQPHYIALSYVKTLPGKAADYRKFIEGDASKMAQMGIAEGILDGYDYLRLTTPYVTESDYDYVQVIWYKNAPPLTPTDTKAWDARVQKAGYKDYQTYLDRRNSMAKVVRATMRTSTARIGQMQAGNYMRTVAYQVDREFRTDFTRLIQDYLAPLAQGRLKDGLVAGWGVSGPAAAFSGVDEAGFFRSISTVFKDSGTLLAGPVPLNEDVMKKYVPGKTYAEYETEVNRLAPHYKVTTTRIHEVVAAGGTLPVVNTN